VPPRLPGGGPAASGRRYPQSAEHWRVPSAPGPTGDRPPSQASTSRRYAAWSGTSGMAPRPSPGGAARPSPGSGPCRMIQPVTVGNTSCRCSGVQARTWPSSSIASTWARRARGGRRKGNNGWNVGGPSHQPVAGGDAKPQPHPVLQRRRRRADARGACSSEQNLAGRGQGSPPVAFLPPATRKRL
jgi:hypothetical protein